MNQIADKPTSARVAENAVIKQALMIMERRIKQGVAKGEKMVSADIVANYLYLNLGNRKRETFSVLLLDKKHRLIKMVELFEGTLSQSAVYPREVIRLVIENDASAIILAHNHPSGNTEPSTADTVITDRLIEALDYMDVVVLDHFIVGETCLSFKREGLMK